MDDNDSILLLAGEVLRAARKQSADGDTDFEDCLASELERVPGQMLDYVAAAVNRRLAAAGGLI